MASVNGVKGAGKRKNARQLRQKAIVATVTPDALRVITDRKTLARAAAMVRGLTDKSKPGAMSLRDLASRTWRGRNKYGFWQHIASRSKSVKLTYLDYRELKALCDLREAGVYANARLERLVIQFQEHMALAQIDVVEIARVVAESQRMA